jgi:hypothetical protein
MKYKMSVIKDLTLPRSGPGNSFTIFSTIPLVKKEQIIVIALENGWFKRDSGGWIKQEDLMFLEDIEATDASKKMQSVEIKNPTQSSLSAEQKALADDQKEIENMTSGGEIDLNTLQIEVANLFSSKGKPYNSNTAILKDLKNTWAMPFQFLKTTDRRITGMDFGRKYYENIVLNMPLLSIIPGKPVFMKGQNMKVKSAILNALSDADKDILNMGTLDEIMDNRYGQYYSFESDYTHYINYVNRLCQQAAVYLGIGKDKAYNTNKPYQNFNWHSYEVNKGNFSELKNDLGFGESVTFFIDSSSNMSESASNDTMESKLNGMTQTVSDVAREAGFLFGPLTGNTNTFKSALAANAEEQIKNMADTYMNDSAPMVDRLRSHVDTLLMGANLVFPEIWRDSNFTRSYNVTIRLQSPYGDVESIYLNIFVPFFHIMALCFPRQVPTSGAHGYLNPFIIRAYCRSLFNCNLGIIDSLSFTKAPNNEWTVDGLPTEIEVSFSIKDLYTVLTLYGGDRESVFFSNTSLIDFIGNMCGVNTYKKDLTRSIESYIAFKTNNLTRALPTLWNGLQENVRNKLFADFLNF